MEGEVEEEEVVVLEAVVVVVEAEEVEEVLWSGSRVLSYSKIPSPSSSRAE